MTRKTFYQLTLLSIVLTIFLTGCGLFGGSQDQVEVLFIGNSYTASNGLPDVFEGLAEAGGYRVRAEMVAPGGWTLADHVASTESIEKIRGNEWDYVVLQEQSVIPSLVEYRERDMYPAARGLQDEVNAIGAETIFFMTWGRRDGLPGEGHPDFSSMQRALEEGYLQIGDELKVPVAPVGIAWWKGLQSDPQLNLWVADGSHPTKVGTYLAACVFYAVIFGQSPEGIEYTGGLDDDLATQLQTIAWETVQPHADLWNLE
jgi:hypothetical protein